MTTENNHVPKSTGLTVLVIEDAKIELGEHSLIACISLNHLLARWNLLCVPVGREPRRTGH